MAKKSSRNSSPARKPVLVLDAGTTGIKALVFTGDEIRSLVYAPLKKTVRRRGKLREVEQDPQELVRIAERVLKSALRKSGYAARELGGFGITNQRETFVLWNRRGQPVYPAIVWEDSRTAREAARLNRARGKEVWQKTGLPVSPYFSATKMQWVFKNVPRAAELAAKGELLAGTVDSWLLWNLAEGHPHVTDFTNASRTLLFNVHTLEWDRELLQVFGIPQSVLPEAKATSSDFGRLRRDLLGAGVPVVALCGDQQSSLFAAGSVRGTTKITYGTGAFVAQALGAKFETKPGFFTTLAPSAEARPAYMLEAKVDDCGVRIAPLIGQEGPMHRAVTRLVKATDAYVRRLPIRPKRLVVDGGVTQYGPLVDIQRKISGLPVARQVVYDGTALGTARLIYKFLAAPIKDRYLKNKLWKEEYSAGGVVFRKSKKGTEILLIQPSYVDLRDKNVWTFPKGWTGDHANEKTEETALREVREEGGVDAEIIADLGEIHYFFSWQGKHVSKTVHHYLMRYSSGNPENHDWEVQEARFVPVSKADKMLVHKTDHEILARARKILPK